MYKFHIFLTLHFYHIAWLINFLMYLLFKASTNKGGETFRVDHLYPGSENRSVVVILYGEIGTPEFSQFHKVLKNQAVEGKIGYVLRHYVKVSFLIRI